MTTSTTPVSCIISTSLLSESLQDLALDKDEYIALLSKLIGESRHVQNNPRQGLVPCEAKVARHVLDVLEPYSTANNGPLIIQQFIYKEGRPNIKITFPGNKKTTTTSFIGSHMDVVPANPETWQRDPFTLEFDGVDKLYGRGTTDCLGHVAVITLLLKALAMRQPSLERSVVALFIAGEEGGETGVGIDRVVQDGALEECKSGICYWIDSADSQPCTGTAGVLQVRIRFCFVLCIVVFHVFLVRRFYATDNFSFSHMHLFFVIFATVAFESHWTALSFRIAASGD
jgi:acetylornithine deacetylase